jgi:hypothetical protein
MYDGTLDFGEIQRLRRACAKGRNTMTVIVSTRGYEIIDHRATGVKVSNRYEYYLKMYKQEIRNEIVQHQWGQF